MSHKRNNKEPNQIESQATNLQPGAFFMLRTPSLPTNELTSWSKDLRCTRTGDKDNGEQYRQLWERDLALVRGRVRNILARPELVQAISLASPVLESSLRYWHTDPSDRKGLQVERSVVRYYQRMCARPTPFGTFAGTSFGPTTPNLNRTGLTLVPRLQYRRISRLDYRVLFNIVQKLRDDARLVKHLDYGVNSSFQRIGSFWHYVETVSDGDKKSHQLVRLEADEALNYVIQRVGHAPLPFAVLVQELVSFMKDDNISTVDAEEYILDLIKGEALVPELVPSVTGSNAVDELIAQLEGIAPAVDIYEALIDARAQMAHMDSNDVSSSTDAFKQLTSTIGRVLPVPVSGSIVQVDLLKPGSNIKLGAAPLNAIRDAVLLAARLGTAYEPPELRRFKEAFASRYDQSWVPLGQALDEETGIGFGTSSQATIPPLVRGLMLHPQQPLASGSTWSPFQMLLLEKLVDAARKGVAEIELSPDDFPVRKSPEQVLPRSFAVFATLSAPSTDEIDAGNFQVLLKGGVGPSGARMMGRFCHLDEQLCDQVKTLLRAEEELDPSSLYAEIVHLPEGRLGNVLSRPVLREYEIVYLGRSGAERSKQISIADLLVTVRHGEVFLYSKRLSRRVIPRLSNAHGYINAHLSSMYRFLCHLQHDGGVTVPAFTWGPLATLGALPRVRVGNIILSLAQWTLSNPEIESLKGSDRFASFVKMQSLRQERGLPRWVVFIEGDNHLHVDLDNPLSVDAFIHALRGTTTALLHERFPSPDNLCVTSEEGNFDHELLIPFTRIPSAENPADTTYNTSLTRDAPAMITCEVSERLAYPGGDWQYCKIYGGEGVLDEILISVLPTLVEKLRGRGLIQWFYLRYADPSQHLRVRVKGARSSLSKALHSALSRYLVAGSIWKIQFDTYEREIERYGGVAGMGEAEKVFTADSDAALSILATSHATGEPSRQWKAALLGMERLLIDAGLSIEERLSLVSKQRISLEKALGLSEHGKQRLAERFRLHREELQALWKGASADPFYVRVSEILERRSVVVRSAVANLLSISAQGKLTVPVSDILISYVHMHVNRVIRSSASTHEILFYEFLLRRYKSEQLHSA